MGNAGKLCACGLLAILGTPFAHADISFVTDAAEYVVAPGDKVAVSVFLEFSGSDAAALLDEQGLYGVGVRLCTLDSTPSSDAASVAAASDVLSGMEFDDPFGALVTLTADAVSALVAVDPFSGDGDLGAIGALNGDVRRVLIGTFLYAPSTQPGEITTIQVGDFSASSDDTVTWRTFVVLDPWITPATFTVRTAPQDCPADYNLDSELDILDFLDFIEDFSTCDQLPSPCGSLGNPDLNGDMFIDILDFLDFLDSFSAGC